VLSGNRVAVLVEEAKMDPAKPDLRRVRDWDMWTLPHWVAGFVILVVTANLAAFLVAVQDVSVHAHDLELFGALLICSAATVELTRRAGENLGFVKDVAAVWELPVAILLPLAYIPLAPAIRFTLIQWRVKQIPVYRRVFSASAISLSYFAAGLLFHAMARAAGVQVLDPARHASGWMLIVAAASAVQWAVNQALVLIAIKGASPEARLREVQFSREPMFNDLAELCVAVVVTFGAACTMIALAFAFPFVSLLQRSLRHAQLLQESRADSKTGLLNAATWEREATAEVARALRTSTPLAVALLDLDKFKNINDTHGHLLGDHVLREIARTLTEVLRDYDLAGRFGGEEFAMLLPQTRSVDAFRIAERVRAHIASMPIHVLDGAERVPVTVSIGVAALDAGSRRDLNELLATADAALYRAKAQGRDQVQMISSSRGLSAVRPPDPDETDAAGLQLVAEADGPSGGADTGNTASSSAVAV
jgi:diguanylate cyclase (GGDEF)-like protein